MSRVMFALSSLLLALPLAAQSPCVILKRMGPADQVTSHMYSFGFRGKQFQFVEGELPKDVKFHGRLTDNDLRKIQDAGGKVVIIDSHYSVEELKEARHSCGAPASAIGVDSTVGASAEPKPAKPQAAAAKSDPSKDWEPFKDQKTAPPPAPASSKHLKLGMTFAEVEGVLGQPETRVDLGPKVLYKYKDMTVEFHDGKVTDVR
jgi:hypothetical protein